MNEKVLQTLEYNKIIDMLVSKAISAAGKKIAAELKPSTDSAEIKLMQTETNEAESMILKKGGLPLGGIKDIAGSVKRAAIGGVLSIAELCDVGEFLYVSRKIVAYGKNDGKSAAFELLDPQFAGVRTAQDLEKEITRCIIGENTIADDASPALYDVRRNIKTSNERVKEHLNSVIHSQNYKNMLQDSVITIRNDRYCVPIKSEYRNSFSGMVHDQSSTGATLFMEPMSVVNLNNQIKEYLAKEKIEIEKVLRKLSEQVAANEELLLSNIEIMTYLDFVFAKGELSLSMNATEPIFNNKGYINIKKARHPLLNPTEVVPIDIRLGREFTLLLVTGPNTGGKTVSLKTVGLFTLMGQAGLHIGAFDNSELAVFDDVFADIGDEQSIEQSLSTFSSHMSNIVKILENITDNSLALFDELGAGTDPTEGAALAIAILQYLHSRKIRAAITTHYSELKVFALATEGVENASCEFNVDTLRPTYKLLIGIPGKSNAFAISQKLGLPEHIISAAKDVLSHEDARFEDVITDLEISKRNAVLEQERAEQYRREAEKMKLELEKQKQKLADSRDKYIMESKNEARQIMQTAKDEADRLLKEMQKHISAASNKDIEATRRELSEKLGKLTDGIDTLTSAKQVYRAVPTSLNKGDGVFIHSMGQKGIVITPPDSSGEVLVQVGIMKIKIHISNLSRDESETKIKLNSKSLTTNVKAGKSLNISHEIDLRGCMVEEGLERAEKYLDDAYLASLSKVTLIHGKGTGALRSAIHRSLKNHPHVKDYRLGTYGEGENGVTIVELK